MCVRVPNFQLGESVVKVSTQESFKAEANRGGLDAASAGYWSAVAAVMPAKLEK